MESLKRTTANFFFFFFTKYSIVGRKYIKLYLNYFNKHDDNNDDINNSNDDYDDDDNKNFLFLFPFFLIVYNFSFF